MSDENPKIPVDKTNLTVYIMSKGDVFVGLTGNEEAPIAIVVPKAGVGLGLPIPLAADLHDALCNALGELFPGAVEEDSAKVTLH